MNIYKLTLVGEETYYSSLAAIWEANDRDALGVTYKQVSRRGVPYSNRKITITKHQVISKKQSMGLDRENKNAAYLLGRLVAMIERECAGDRELPARLPALCDPKECNNALDAWLERAWKKSEEHGTAEELKAICEELHAQGVEKQTDVKDTAGAYWMGYYHQRKADSSD